jgi:hypothetical protein
MRSFVVPCRWVRRGRARRAATVGRTRVGAWHEDEEATAGSSDRAPRRRGVCVVASRAEVDHAAASSRGKEHAPARGSERERDVALLTLGGDEDATHGARG